METLPWKTRSTCWETCVLHGRGLHTAIWKGECEGQLLSLVTQLRADGVVPPCATLYLWCGVSNLCEECFFDNQVYWARDIDLEIRFGQHQERARRLIVRRQNVEVPAMPPACLRKVFVSVPAGGRVMTKHAHYTFQLPSFLVLYWHIQGPLRCQGTHWDDHPDGERAEDRGLFLGRQPKLKFVPFVLAWSVRLFLSGHSCPLADGCLRRHWGATSVRSYPAGWIWSGVVFAGTFFVRKRYFCDVMKVIIRRFWLCLQDGADVWCSTASRQKTV